MTIPECQVVIHPNTREAGSSYTNSRQKEVQPCGAQILTRITKIAKLQIDEE